MGRTPSDKAHFQTKTPERDTAEKLMKQNTITHNNGEGIIPFLV